MELAKLTITPEETSEIDEFEVLFNPNTYSISKSLTWNAEVSNNLNASTLGFGGSTNRDLTLELFYDVTETPDSDVRVETNKVVALTRLKRDGREPPLVQITWGDDSQDLYNFPFIGVVSQLTQRFTLFRANGKPVVRSDEKAIHRPSGDHAGRKSPPGPEVSAFAWCVWTSSVQRSAVPPARVVTKTICRPSGEKAA